MGGAETITTLEQVRAFFPNLTEDEVDAAAALFLLGLGRGLSRNEVDPIDNQLVGARLVTKKVEKVAVPSSFSARFLRFARRRWLGSKVTAAYYVPSRLPIADGAWTSAAGCRADDVAAGVRFFLQVRRTGLGDSAAPSQWTTRSLAWGRLCHRSGQTTPALSTESVLPFVMKLSELLPVRLIAVSEQSSAVPPLGKETRVAKSRGRAQNGTAVVFKETRKSLHPGIAPSGRAVIVLNDAGTDAAFGNGEAGKQRHHLAREQRFELRDWHSKISP
jgi:hypothetical protein